MFSGREMYNLRKFNYCKCRGGLGIIGFVNLSLFFLCLIFVYFLWKEFEMKNCNSIIGIVYCILFFIVN